MHISAQKNAKLEYEQLDAIDMVMKQLPKNDCLEQTN